MEIGGLSSAAGRMREFRKRAEQKPKERKGKHMESSKHCSSAKGGKLLKTNGR